MSWIDIPRQETTGVPLRVSVTVPVVPPVPFVTEKDETSSSRACRRTSA